jgi:hypothetical protein
MFEPKCVINYVARKELGAGNSVPVYVEDKSLKPPEYGGRSYHWETNGGRTIWHPSAYSKKGWSNMKYVASTRHILVGKDWLVKKVCEDYPQWADKMVGEL